MIWINCHITLSAILDSCKYAYLHHNHNTAHEIVMFGCNLAALDVLYP